jgi:hypothetical protein
MIKLRIFYWVLVWIGNGFNFRKTRAELVFNDEMLQEQEAQKNREGEKRAEQWRAERKERLGW